MSRHTSQDSLILRHSAPEAVAKQPGVAKRPSRRVSHNPAENEQLRAEVALYVASMATELAAMARAANYDVLAYFLDMARMEAKVRAKELDPAQLQQESA